MKKRQTANRIADMALLEGYTTTPITFLSVEMAPTGEPPTTTSRPYRSMPLRIPAQILLLKRLPRTIPVNRLKINPTRSPAADSIRRPELTWNSQKTAEYMSFYRPAMNSRAGGSVCGAAGPLFLIPFIVGPQTLLFQPILHCASCY